MKGENKMRVTRVMKDYVEKEFDAKRLAANKEYRASYDERRRACLEEIKKLVDEARCRCDEILAKYGMDIIEGKRDNAGYYGNEVIRYYDQCVQNQKEWQAIRDHEHKLYQYQKEALERFYLECDLGCDKEKFFEMVAALNFDNV